MFPKFKLQVISDIHIENNKESITNLIIPDKDAILIITGDVGRVENYEEYSKCIGEFCKLFQRVLLIPGNHEYYTGDKTLSYNKVNAILFSLERLYQNLSVLINTYIIISNVLIFGSTFWSYSPHQHWKNIPIYDDSEAVITSGLYNRLHMSAQEGLESAIVYARRMKYDVVVATHHAPTFYDTLALKYRNHNDSKNYMYCSHSDHFLENDIIKYWIYGHTGYNSSHNKLISNQVNIERFDKKKVIELN